MTDHLVIFAKSPRLGVAKRRLGRQIGMVPAWRFYRDALTSLLVRLGHDPRWRTWVYMTPDRDAELPIWPGRCRGMRVVAQGGGDLGERMSRPFRTLPPGRVVLIGSDIPKIRARHVAAAFRLLGFRDLVFGPASDGGFWLIGGRGRLRLPPGLFAGVRWSTPTVLRDTLANVPPRYSIGLTETLDDIDTAEALLEWRRRCGGIRPGRSSTKI
jgi:uncharacterized protein